MRYYKIEIDGVPIFTSLTGSGKTNPGALQVEFDFTIAPFDQPSGAAFVRIWGITRELVSQANDLNFKAIKVYGGMQKGLPLANPQQSGLLLQGYIQQAFGNWLGTEMSLDLMIVPGEPPATGTSKTAPKNIVLTWKKGQTMADAIKPALTTAFSGLTPIININPKIVMQNDIENGFYENLTQFAKYLRETSIWIIGKDYSGVSVTMDEKNINVYDGTKTSSEKVIDFKDLIGQPTWIDSPSIQFKCAMRSDVKLGDQVTMPKTLVTNSARAQSSLTNQKANFQGKFQVSQVRCIGNYRQPSADSWVTVFNAFPVATTAAS